MPVRPPRRERRLTVLMHLLAHPQDYPLAAGVQTPGRLPAGCEVTGGGG